MITATLCVSCIQSSRLQYSLGSSVPQNTNRPCRSLVCKGAHKSQYFPSLLQWQLVLRSSRAPSSPTRLPGGMAFNCSKTNRMQVYQRKHRTYPTIPSQITDTREYWGEIVRQYTCSICFHSQSATSLLMQGGRDSLCVPELLKPQNQALNHIRPQNLKHFSTEMSIQLASGGFRLKGIDTAVGYGIVK